jgi:hypothetical protein
MYIKGNNKIYIQALALSCVNFRFVRLDRLSPDAKARADAKTQKATKVMPAAASTAQLCECGVTWVVNNT